MQKITYEMALRALNEAVKANGYDHVYKRSQVTAGCYNVTLAGEPDCIVGWSLIWLGIPAEWFLGKDEGHLSNRRGAGSDLVCSMLKKAEMFEVDEDARRLFRFVQGYQDDGMAWGAAVTQAHLGNDWFHSLAAR